MKQFIPLLALVALTACNKAADNPPASSPQPAEAAPAPAATAGAGAEWGQFRGPNGDGSSDAKGLPVKWSEKENVKWKAEVPGSGHSSPVIAGNQIWMTTAFENGRKLHALCFDRDSGKLVHNLELFQSPSPEAMQAKQNGYASPTPVIDGSRVYLSFGTYGSACIDMKTGTVVWRSNQIQLFHDNNGPGSSPIIYKDLFILNCDGVGQRYIAALDKNTGAFKWGTRRSNNPGGGWIDKAFSTATIFNIDGQDQIVSAYSKRVSGYDPATGQEIWAMDFGTTTVVPRPVLAHGLLYVHGGNNDSEFYAIKVGGKGLLPADRIVWSTKRQVPKVAGLVISGDEIFMVNETGIATCFDAKSGTKHWDERVGGDHYSSPVLADGRVYFSNDAGKTTVVKASKTYNVEAINELDGGIMASPAIAGKALFIRTKTHLYRIEN